ncbi:zinc-binding dehydrogenase [Kitasatospora griseola]|uniref:zinc-binding dehydrogenase n=1 Tax=Kitasatospora griseola TaxID=2064 RepID=UPI00364AA533
MTRAVVTTGAGGGLSVEDVHLAGPDAGQVRVRLVAAGVCHSDLSLHRGTLPHKTPAVLGHEGAGVVTEVGSGVEHVRAGDHVVLNWRAPCRSCAFCRNGEPYLCSYSDLVSRKPYGRLADGTPVYPGLGVAAFAEETVLPESGVVKVPSDVPPEVAALLGCAALTGFGAVVNCARVRPGQSAVVFGVGGVGRIALQTLRLVGAGTIVAVDASADKEKAARQSGATHFLPASPDLLEEIRELTDGRGCDHAIECVGGAATVRQAWDCTRRGGTVTVVGAGGRDDRVSFTALELFHSARRLVGCLHGNATAERDVPVLLDHVRAGRMDIGALVSDRIPLDGVAGAFDRLAAHQGGRSLVLL